MYGKIFERVFTGSMFGSGPVVFSVWAYVIAHAEPPGIVELNPRLLAVCIGTSSEEVRAALAFLCRPDPESQNPAEEGRRLVHVRGHEYHVVSFEKYREMRDQEARRDYMRKYMAERRAKGGRVTELTEVNSKQRLAKLAEAEAEAEAEEKNKDAANAADLWDFGIETLKASGLGDRSARSFLGSLCKTHDDAVVLDALRASAGMADPKSYALAVLKDKPRRGQGHKSEADKVFDRLEAEGRVA